MLSINVHYRGPIMDIIQPASKQLVIDMTTTCIPKWLLHEQILDRI